MISRPSWVPADRRNESRGLDARLRLCAVEVRREALAASRVPEIKVPTLYIDRVGEKAHLARLERVRRERDQAAVRRALDDLRRVAEGNENTMPAIIEAVKAYATLGEIMDVFRTTFGEYMEPAVF